MSQPAQRSFAGGEIAPSLYARTDLSKYATGLRTCRNMMVQKHGGSANRPGTLFSTEVKNSANAVRFIKFERTSTAAYVLEFGNLYVRIIKNGVYLQATGSGWDVGLFYVRGDTAESLGIWYVRLTNGSGGAAPAGNPTDWYPLTGTIYELPTPYISADLPAIRFAQRSQITTQFGSANGDRGTILVLTHPSYAARELQSISETLWALITTSFVPAVGTPTTLVLGGGSAGAIRYWTVTAVSETGEESLPLTGSSIDRIPSVGTPTSVSWTAPALGWPVVASYRVYRSEDGVSYGFIGKAAGTSFSDTGVTADLLNPPPGTRTLFDVANKYPTAVTHYQQRQLFGNTNTEQETIWASRTNRYSNFSISFPLQDDDGVTFTMVGKVLNAVQHLADLGRLIAFTSNEEKIVEGGEDKILRPDAINPRKLSSHGSGILRPIELDDTAIFLQARGTIVRDLKPISSDSYTGTDLSVFAAHLFLGYEIVDWDYAENPHSIVWAVRSDGILLGLTYLREHDIWGWHRHDTDGMVENVCVIPEGDEDKVYLVVRRTINGSSKRYIERFASRFITDQEDMIFMDSAKSYDGWNVAATTITLSTAGGWTHEDLLTATANAGVFAAADVDNAILFRYTDDDGEEQNLRFIISSYTSATVVKGFAQQTVPAGLRAVAQTTWALAKKIMTGLSHLEGKSLSVLGDGYVVASPNNTGKIGGELSYPEVIVSGGSITLPEPYAKIHAGLPYISDIVTLDLDLPGSATIKDKKILINRLGIYVEEARGIWAGMPDQPTEDDPLNGLQEYKARYAEDYGDPIAPKTGFIDLSIEARADENGRQMIRQVDPLPLTVLAIMPMVMK